MRVLRSVEVGGLAGTACIYDRSRSKREYCNARSCPRVVGRLAGRGGEFGWVEAGDVRAGRHCLVSVNQNPVKAVEDQLDCGQIKRTCAVVR